MPNAAPISSLFDWTWHRLTANYWSLALGAALLAPLAFAILLYADKNGAAAWLVAHDLTPVANAETARNVASVVAGINTAYLALYFSIAVIVLTLAAGNLGVRLIDRWLGKRLVRVSIAGLCLNVLFAVLTMSAIDHEATLARTPLLTFAVMILLLFVNTIMLAVATHDLGRSMFIDRGITNIAQDGANRELSVFGKQPEQAEMTCIVASERNGYVEGFDLEKLSKALKDCGTARLCVAPGQHVFKGQELIRSTRPCSNSADVLHAIPIGPFRSSSQGAVYQSRLLVEIAARALSPAINDFYTAIAAVDGLVELAMGHRDNWVDDGLAPASEAYPNIELAGRDFRALFEDPLAALRQSAADYPPVAIRIIGNLEQFLKVGDTPAPGLCAFLQTYVVTLHEHARARCETDYDRQSLDRALSQFQESVDS